MLFRDSCFSDYFTCDGRCISRDWVGDGWPDCMDGSDEQARKYNFPQMFEQKYF